MNFLDSEPDPKQFRALKLFLIATLAVGAVAQLAASPAPVPVPPWAIAPLWTLSYGLMAVAGWLAFKRAGLKSFALALFAAQLALNLLWRLAPLPALGLAMNLCALATLILFARRNFVAAVTFLPCVIWYLFASLPMNGFWPLH
jgi:tryptophan-rich sensory protein